MCDCKNKLQQCELNKTDFKCNHNKDILNFFLDKIKEKHILSLILEMKRQMERNNCYMCNEKKEEDELETIYLIEEENFLCLECIDNLKYDILDDVEDVYNVIKFSLGSFF